MTNFEKIQDTFDKAAETGGNTTCILCGTSYWLIDPKIRDLPGTNVEGAAHVVALTCGGCGNMRFLNAEVLGLDLYEEIASEEKELRLGEIGKAH